jgi:hypothetical protein
MTRITALLLALLFLSPPALAQSRPKRARLPNFSPSAGQGIFFENVFEQGLQGPRPANLGQAAAPVAAGGANSGGSSSPAPAAAGAEGGGGGLYPWSKVVSPTTLEDEVKTLKLATDQSVTTPTKFAGGDYRTVRRDFSILAMLFGIVAEYDGEVRWKDSAPAARDLFARTAANAKVGTQQVYNEAKQRRDQLGDLLNGVRIENQSSEPKTNWSEAVSRAPLMQKLEAVYQSKVLPWTGNPGDFKANADELKRHAEIVAAVAEVLKQEGMEDASDSEYTQHCDHMKQAALEIVGAIKENNQDQAAKAAGQIGQACSQCHELYRG